MHSSQRILHILFLSPHETVFSRFLFYYRNHHFNTWKFCRSRVVILRLFDDRLALLWYRLLIWRGRKTSSYSCFGYTKACDNPVNNAEVPASKQSQPVNCCRRIARTCFLRPPSCHKMRMPGSPNPKPLYQAAKLKQDHCVSFKPNVSMRALECHSSCHSCGCGCVARLPAADATFLVSLSWLCSSQRHDFCTSGRAWC